MIEQADQHLFSTPARSFEEMSFKDLAEDWVQRVAAVSTLAMDSYVITNEGRCLVREAREEYNTQFEGQPTPSAEEQARRDKEWREIARSVVNADPAVIEKNHFLCSLIEQDDSHLSHGTKLLATLRKQAERTGNDQSTYLEQFLALWAIYKHGQISELDT